MAAPDVDVREVAPSDRETVDALIATARADLGEDTRAAYLFARGRVDEIRDTTPRQAGVFAAIGSFDEVPCGLVLAHVVDEEPDVVHVPWLYVEEPFRRCAVAEALLVTVERWAIAQGATRLDVVASPGDRAAKSFLEEAGMKARAIVMSRALTVTHGTP